MIVLLYHPATNYVQCPLECPASVAHPGRDYTTLIALSELWDAFWTRALFHMTGTFSKRVLFVILGLPRPLISVRGLVTGQEPMSGTHSTTLLVADGLAQRGWDVGMLTLDGGRLADTSIVTFSDLQQAHSWLGNNRAVWSYHGPAGIMERLREVNIRPVVWSHIDLTPEISDWLDQDWITGVVTVSDFCRLALLHQSKHRRIGRIYNPLNPFYADDGGTWATEPGHQRQAVFSGYIGESKGAHRVFQCWGHVRRALPDAQLVVAGSAKLYRDDASIGPFGVAKPEFEERYIYPLVQDFGSLEKAGVRLVGLLSPVELRALYRRSSLGVINLNERNATESFSCSGVEMAACGLRVFSVASAALPETVGFTGNAVLVNRPAQLVPAFIDALRRPKDLKNIEVQRQQVRDRYRLSRIVDYWEELLLAPADRFYDLAGPWQYNKNFRYVVKKMLARIHAGGLLDRILQLRTRLQSTS
jgi:glycosyltransferase involved in cell wall biosynthesis